MGKCDGFDWDLNIEIPIKSIYSEILGTKTPINSGINSRIWSEIHFLIRIRFQFPLYNPFTMSLRIIHLVIITKEHTIWKDQAREKEIFIS